MSDLQPTKQAEPTPDAEARRLYELNRPKFPGAPDWDSQTEVVRLKWIDVVQAIQSEFGPMSARQ
jgi:hypothetical protein